MRTFILVTTSISKESRDFHVFLHKHFNACMMLNAHCSLLNAKLSIVTHCWTYHSMSLNVGRIMQASRPFFIIIFIIFLMQAKFSSHPVQCWWMDASCNGARLSYTVQSFLIIFNFFVTFLYSYAMMRCFVFLWCSKFSYKLQSSKFLWHHAQCWMDGSCNDARLVYFCSVCPLPILEKECL